MLEQSCPERNNFGDLITADHKILSVGSESRNNHRYALVVQDFATQWIRSYQRKTKTSQETQKNLMKFLETTRKPKVIYTDNSLEFGKFCEELSWNRCTSTPSRSETNGIAERAVRRVKEGTSAVLLQSGLDEKWWTDCETSKISCLMGKCHMKGGSESPLNAPVIPFGAMVEYHPISAKDQSKQHQFGAKILPGIFRCYALYAEGIWKGDVMVPDIEELKEMDASELHARRLNAKEVLTPQRSGNFIFPVADGTDKIFGEEQPLRTSTSTRERPERGEEQEICFKESSPTPTSRRLNSDDEEARVDFWTITGEFIYRHHVVTRVKVYVPTEESFPFR